ncbi:MAG: hypothetical protein SOV03_06980 [Faecalibacterium sp.]|nr:hypothetical protein [Faecalibacterium sp.]
MTSQDNFAVRFTKHKEELDTLTVDKLESILAFANKAASITTSRHGAIRFVLLEDF